jgi:hypothetical protein
LESNLKRLDESQNLFQNEETVTKCRVKVQRAKEPTPAEEGKDSAQLWSKFYKLEYSNLAKMEKF